jgi:2-keto-4-pentenoate hydratase/2-oxohepta-3-ene-1,7-dioic acid hydratase in catechol pathway
MQWIRIEHNNEVRFGTLSGNEVSIYLGDMFASPTPSGETVSLQEAVILPPLRPGKIVALANNFHALIEKFSMTLPSEPLYFIKANTSLHPHGKPIQRPKGYDGKVVFEGELGLVIGRTCKNVTTDDALSYLFGCTCVNDVTAIGLLNKDPSFQQWTRAKAPDTFGVLGPVITTGLDPSSLHIVTHLNGQERQNYPVTDMVFTPAELISLISNDLTLEPGDVIACGTSVGVGSMKDGAVVTVIIEGIGSLENTFQG